MATKKSSRQKSKTVKHTPAEAQKIGKLVVIFGVLLACILGVFFYIKSNKGLSYADQQRIHAFDGLAKNYLYQTFTKDGEQTAVMTGSGITDDNDLYADFVIEKFEDHIIVSYQKARLHFQCHKKDSLEFKDGCSYAYWYDEEKETSDASRDAQKAFYEAIEEYTDAVENEEEESVLNTLKDAYNKALEKVKPYLEELQKLAE